MTDVLIIYSSTDGHTIRICSHLSERLKRSGRNVRMCELSETSADDLNRTNMILIGAAIRYGKHKPQVYDFIASNREFLDSRLSGFFSVCLVARKANKNTPQTNPYFKKFLKRSGWQPDLMAVFAGKVNYPIYNWSDRLMIRFIMWITKGPTDPQTVKEFTDWQRVNDFAIEINNRLK